MANAEFGPYIRERRLALGLKQGEAAKLSDISADDLFTLENGEQLAVSPEVLSRMLIRLAGVIEVHRDVLLFKAGLYPPDIDAARVPSVIVKRAFAMMREGARG